ncbi:hypothetical protein AAY473_016449 [Plecturocebus cupreus]
MDFTNFNQIFLSGHLSKSSSPVLLSEEYLLQEALSSEADQPPPSDLLRQFQKKVPRVWTETNSLGLASHRTPVVVQLLATVTPVQV